jgi:hypothetical protein
MRTETKQPCCPWCPRKILPSDLPRHHEAMHPERPKMPPRQDHRPQPARREKAGPPGQGSLFEGGAAYD